MTLKPLDFPTLAARALNFSRVVHKPTYAGLRLLLESLGNDPDAFATYLDRQCRVRTHWRYFSFQIVKDAAPGGPPAYRNCTVGSPLTALAEAHVLALMAREPAFAVHPAAYSYRWPAGRGDGRNFEYFLTGYDGRNKAVARLLSENPDSVAVIADVKAFYPNVQNDRVRAEVAGRCKRVADASTRETITRFAAGLLDPGVGKGGLPIGPDLSHALGHLALAPVDAALGERFPGRYLRYVDDIVLVVPKRQVAESLQAVRDALECEGLKLNEAKLDEVAAATWRAEAVDFQPADGPATFEELIAKITLYLIRRPGEADALHARLRDAGFALPVDRLRGLAKSRRFRWWLGRPAARKLFGWFAGWFTSQESLLTLALAVRRDLMAAAGRLAGAAVPQEPQRRRWYVQKRRYVLNRLLYLHPASAYRTILGLTPSIEEFSEARAVLQSLASRDCSEALRYPGRAAAALCQLWPEHHRVAAPAITWPAAATRADAEVAAHFALFLSVDPPEAYLRAVAASFPGARILIEMCRGRSAPESVHRMSCLDEMNLLYAGRPRDELLRLVNARFDELEDVGVEGLTLGGSAYPGADGPSPHSG